MDPLTALAAIKTGVAAGKQLHNLSKEIAGFFDATDGAKRAHAKKKNGIKTPNEVREKEGMEPLPAGDDLMIQGATVPIEVQGAGEEKVS